MRPEVRSLAATKAGRSTRSRGGYPQTASSGKRTMCAPSRSARRPSSRIFAALPSKSPTVVSICATATRRRGRESVTDQGASGEPVRRRRRLRVARRPEEQEAARRRGRERPEPAPERRRRPGLPGKPPRGAPRGPRGPCRGSGRTPRSERPSRRPRGTRRTPRPREGPRVPGLAPVRRRAAEDRDGREQENGGGVGRRGRDAGRKRRGSEREAPARRAARAASAGRGGRGSRNSSRGAESPPAS